MPRAVNVQEKRMAALAKECIDLTGPTGMWNQEASSLSGVVSALGYLDARGRQKVWESVKRIFPGEFGPPTLTTPANHAKALGLAESDKERT